MASALLFGAQHTQVLLPVALASALAALWVKPRAPGRAYWFLVGLAAYTLLQLVPLPFGWLEVLSPNSAGVWRGALRPFGDGPPRFATLSVDPAATALEGVKWSAYACVFLAARGLRERHGGTPLAVLVFCSALAVAMVTLLHGVIEARRIYGLFLPSGNLLWNRGPIINPNTLAGYLNLGFFAGLGVWFERRDVRWVRLMPLGLALLALNVILTRSRGGVAALVVGGILFAFLAIRQRRPDWVRMGALAAACIVAIVGGAVALGGPALQADLLDADFAGKASGWAWATGLVADFSVFGAGRGAFETAFQPYRQPLARSWTAVYAHAENFPLEWAADWGIPVGGAAFIGSMIAISIVAKRALRDPMAAGIAAGLIALLLQNLVDLGLEIFAVTASALVAFAAAQSSSKRESDSESNSRWTGFVAPAGVLLASTIAVVMGAHPVKVERAHVSKAYSEFARTRSRDPGLLVEKLRDAIKRHPGEAYFPLIGALIARRSGNGDPLRWLARALERAPMNGNTHIVLAQTLAARGARHQAMIHVRLTSLYDVTLRDYALEQAAAWARTPGELVAVFPRGTAGSELLEDLCEKARGEHAVDCWREALSRRPTARSRHRLAEALLDALEAGGIPCAPPADVDCAAELQKELSPSSWSGDWRFAMHLARFTAFRGDPLGAARVALEGCPASAEAAGCIERALEFARRTGDHATLASVGERYLSLHCGEPIRCATANDLVGRTYAQLGLWGLALRHYSAAAHAEPTLDRWLKNAEAAAQAGSSVAARVALERARREGVLSGAHAARLDSIERLLVKGSGD